MDIYRVHLYTFLLCGEPIRNLECGSQLDCRNCRKFPGPAWPWPTFTQTHRRSSQPLSLPHLPFSTILSRHLSHLFPPLPSIYASDPESTHLTLPTLSNPTSLFCICSYFLISSPLSIFLPSLLSLPISLFISSSLPDISHYSFLSYTVSLLSPPFSLLSLYLSQSFLSLFCPPFLSLSLYPYFFFPSLSFLYCPLSPFYRYILPSLSLYCIFVLQWIVGLH